MIFECLEARYSDYTNKSTKPRVSLKLNSSKISENNDFKSLTLYNAIKITTMFVTSLDFSNCKMDEDFLDYLLKIILDNYFNEKTTYELLNISNNNFFKKAIQSLSEFITTKPIHEDNSLMISNTKPQYVIRKLIIEDIPFFEKIENMKIILSSLLISSILVIPNVQMTYQSRTIRENIVFMKYLERTIKVNKDLSSIQLHNKSIHKIPFKILDKHNKINNDYVLYTFYSDILMNYYGLLIPEPIMRKKSTYVKLNKLYSLLKKDLCEKLENKKIRKLKIK